MLNGVAGTRFIWEIRRGLGRMRLVLPNAEWILPLALGTAAFLVVVGPYVLDPTNIAWLNSESDPATHYLGWDCFRHSKWTIPLGANPNYGMELSSSIVYSDSNPGLAIFFKLFSPWLPQPFQYFGFWLLICFVLQGWFGWRLVGLTTTSPTIRIFGAGLFVFSPPMFWRLNVHSSLSGHFLILASLYFAIQHELRARRLKWALLLSTAALVHCYLLVICVGIWLADASGRWWRDRRNVRQPLLEVAVIASVVAFSSWQAGYFCLGSGASIGGYGNYRLNLLSLVDAGGWSHVLPDLPEAEGDREGFNFLGLGVLLLILVGIPILLRRRLSLTRFICARPFLTALMVLFTLYAVSNNIGFGASSFNFPIGNDLRRAADVVRCSGRIFWPVFYVVLLTGIAVVVRGSGKVFAISILGGAFIVQACDTSAGWANIRAQLMSEPDSTWPTMLRNPFWNEASAHYACVRMLKPSNQPSFWREAASFAVLHRLPTNVIYLARVDSAKCSAARRRGSDSLASGTYDADTLYVLTDAELLRAAMTLREDQDLLVRVDGMLVLAPGWKSRASTTTNTYELRKSDVLRECAMSSAEKVGFAESELGTKLLQNGWRPASGDVAWSTKSFADIVIPVSFQRPSKVEIDADARITSAVVSQQVQVLVHGAATESFTLTELQGNRLTIHVPESARDEIDRLGYVSLQFKFPDAVQADHRDRKTSDVVAIGLRSLKIY